MADINGVNQNTSVYEQINTQNKQNSTATGTSQSQETSEMFMQLMIAQLKNQSPTSPAETTDFMQQISSMSSVESIANLNSTVEQMSTSLMNSQTALQASSMVGQTAYIKTDKGILPEGGSVKGVVALPASASQVRVSIYDKSGSLVDRVFLGARGVGDHDFEWNKDDALPGEYQMVAEAQVGDEFETVQSFIGYSVNSVTLGQNGIGMALNTDAGSVGINDVRQLGKG
ncbi:flagellar hook capping FlgD N-terminal domain-containing protein [Pontibacterium sp.]|uniref:flagellar hook capping FlgD N-terminal domain-containing protein n=1 Tax=Pontibacterium sp. TaxID=2036026 RepID=UPI003561C1DB